MKIRRPIKSALLWESTIGSGQLHKRFAQRYKGHISVISLLFSVFSVRRLVSLWLRWLVTDNFFAFMDQKFKAFNQKRVMQRRLN